MRYRLDLSPVYTNQLDDVDNYVQWLNWLTKQCDVVSLYHIDGDLRRYSILEYLESTARLIEYTATLSKT